MLTNYFKYVIIIISFVYCTIRISDMEYYDFYGGQKNVDLIFFIIFIVSICVYYFIKKTNYLTLDDLKKYAPLTPLEYEIVSSKDNKFMKRMYVKRINDLFWKEIDYSFTVNKNCPIGDAINFISKNETVETLNNTMKHNSTINGNKISHNLMVSESICIGVVVLAFLITIFIVYFTVDEKIQSNNNNKIERYYNSF